MFPAEWILRSQQGQSNRSRVGLWPRGGASDPTDRPWADRAHTRTQCSSPSSFNAAEQKWAFVKMMLCLHPTSGRKDHHVMCFHFLLFNFFFFYIYFFNGPGPEGGFCLSSGAHLLSVHKTQSSQCAASSVVWRGDMWLSVLPQAPHPSPLGVTLTWVRSSVPPLLPQQTNTFCPERRVQWISKQGTVCFSRFAMAQPISEQGCLAQTCSRR